jgi:ABC-type Zn uptake system ZnuABC Zn-binding protein ZnuA/ABC-type Mn2+/Zn2+ transport system permease subunit
VPGVFHYAFVQRGLLEVLLLALGAGLLGTWIVLRGLAFTSHAVGTAVFPGLVLADGLGFSPLLGAFGAAAAFALALWLLARDGRGDYGSLTALVLVGSLALGVILASDVFHSGANVETLLFGSLLVIGTRELVLAGAMSAFVLAATVLLGRRWLATGFDPVSAPALGLRSPLPEGILVAVVALGAIACVSALGALLVTALLVVPAATTRLWLDRLLPWQLATVGLVLVEGVAGLWISVEANVPPGAAIAVLAGAVFAVAALARVVPRPAALAAAAGAAVFLVAGCGSGGGNGKPVVVATTTQIADWARIVGGDRIAVHQILQPNTDPHEYEPRPDDVKATSGAKVVFENGDGLDTWMGKVVSRAGGKPKVVVLAGSVPVQLAGEKSGPEASRYDPHWWHDPTNAMSAVQQIRSSLTMAIPSGKETFARNAAAYVKKLTALDGKILGCLATVPGPQRKLVTDHDAFNYFASRYGIKVVGAAIPSQSTQAQPSAGATARLIRLIRREHVKAIFPESSLNQALAKTIARETGATADYTLYGDTLGPKGSPGATYLAMEAANTEAMVAGFTGGQFRCAIRIP